MARIACEQVRSALQLSLSDYRQPVQTPGLAHHIVGCTACQAERLVLYTQLLPMATPPIDACTRCEADLAAYVDTVLDQGNRIAAQTYPHVWWHMWTCQECAEIFAQTAALAAAERAGDLAPLPVARAVATSARQTIGKLFVRPLVLTHIVQRHALLGVSYGDEPPMIVDEHDEDAHSFQLSMRQERDGRWQVLVTVMPPISGFAAITIG
ncbi:MAG: hypothetical protein HGA19_16725, partial [Oscillochloris sp.]|nr:hypothetical protein [Oscillochloris sp.]